LVLIFLQKYHNQAFLCRGCRLSVSDCGAIQELGQDEGFPSIADLGFLISEIQ